MQQHSPENGFDCRSGCIGPEACINAFQIRKLHIARQGLSATLENRSAADIRKAQGSLSSIQAQESDIQKRDAALYGACGLYQMERDNLMTDVVPIEDMPSLD